MTQSRLPDPIRHVAIIMDGNGRWAAKRMLPRIAGHKKGGKAVDRTVTAAAELGIEHLTLYAFSSENWSRPKDEVADLMKLLTQYLKKELATLIKNNIQFRMIGDRTGFAQDVLDLIDAAEAQTADNTGLQLNIALGYGARQEIMQAVKDISVKIESGEMKSSDLGEDTLSSSLYTKGIPDPDLVIRTSGEQRLSNFLLWQSAYAEFYFTDTFWPDFNKDELIKAMHDFHGRERRFGGVSERVSDDSKEATA